MATGMQSWSTTAASNNTADSSVNWSEGQAPSTVNDSARAEMASVAKWRDDNNGTLSTTGTTSAFTVTSNQGSTGNIDGQTITVQFHATANAGATLSRDSATAAAIQLYSGANLVGGEFISGSIHRFKYSSASTSWIKIGHETNFSYNTLQSESDNTALMNVQGAAWPPQEVKLGTGLVLSTTSTSTSQSAWTTTTTSTAIPFTISAPAFPPSASFKNLSIKVTGTSSATVAADYVTVASTGNSFVTLPTASNINLGTSGAVDALDTGSIASGTWYAIYAIATTTSTAAHGLASTSFTTPLMPSGYTYKARIGAIVTSTSTSASQLMGTWQFGKRAQYILGLAQTTTMPVIASLAGGTWSQTTPTYATLSTTKFVPSTASHIGLIATTQLGAYTAQDIIMAPNTSYSGQESANPPPISLTSVNQTAQAWMMLESSNIAWATTNTTNGAGSICIGWEDNL